MENPGAIFEWIGKFIVAAGGLSFIVYEAFKWLASKWLENKFEERLQSLKHEQGKEIENLRLKISMMLDRATKLNQHEYELLPEAWAKLNESFWALKAISLSLQTYPDIDRMDEKQFDEFVEELEFRPWEKRELREAKDKNKFYQKQTTLRKHGETKNKISDAAIFLSRKGIFIPPAILEKMKALNDMVWRTYVEYELSNTIQGVPWKTDRLMEFSEKGEVMLAELEGLVHKRLWPIEPTLESPMPQS